MSMQTQEQETEVVQGTVVGIIQKGLDKWQVAVKVDPNSQYAKNLWTKDQSLVNQLTALIGSQQAFVCGVSHWTNQSGQPVRSLWINGVGPQAAAQQAVPQDGMQTVGQVMAQNGWQAQAQQPPLPQYSGPAEPYVDPVQGMIHRQTASKVAAHLLASGVLPPDVPRDFGTFLVLCERLVAYYDRGIPQPNTDSSYYGDPDGDIPFLATIDGLGN